MTLRIDKNSTEPLYLQLAGQLIDAIENHVYIHKQRLPTEDQIVSLLSVSKGTVKSAYAHMETLGYVKKIRGSGVYVDKIPTEKSSSQIIMDSFFESFDLQDDVTSTQGYLVFQDKLDSAFSANMKLHVALVSSSREILTSLSNQLSKFDNVSFFTYLVSELLSGERIVNPLCKLLLIPQKHQDAIIRYTVPSHIRTEHVIWNESKQTITSLCKIPSDNIIGIVYTGENFLSSIMDTLHTLQISNKIVPILNTEIPKNIDKYNAYSFIVADCYSELYCAKSLEFIEKMRKRGSSIIPFSCEIDNGSMHNIEEKINEVFSSLRRHNI